MDQIPASYVIVALIALVIFWKKGYLKLPSGIGATSSSEVLGRKFIAAVTREAQEDNAIFIANKVREDVKAKLQVPFGAPESEAEKPKTEPL